MIIKYHNQSIILDKQKRNKKTGVRERERETFKFCDGGGWRWMKREMMREWDRDH